MLPDALVNLAFMEPPIPSLGIQTLEWHQILTTKILGFFFPPLLCHTILPRPLLCTQENMEEGDISLPSPAQLLFLCLGKRPMRL